MPQLSYPNRTKIGREGQVADVSLAQIDSFLVETSIVKVGLLTEQGSSDRLLDPLAPLTPTAPEAIKLPFASEATEQSLVASDFDGAIGSERSTRAKSIIVTLDASADWIDSDGFIIGIDASGKLLAPERFHIPAGGGVAIPSKRAYCRAVETYFPPQGGGGGEASIGFSNDVVEVGPATNPGVGVYDPYIEYLSQLGEYRPRNQINCMLKGRFYARPEHDVTAGEEAYVRIVADGDDVLGQFTGYAGAADPATYARVHKAKWRDTTASRGLAKLEIDFTA